MPCVSVSQQLLKCQGFLTLNTSQALPCFWFVPTSSLSSHFRSDMPVFSLSPATESHPVPHDSSSHCNLVTLTPCAHSATQSQQSHQQLAQVSPVSCSLLLGVQKDVRTPPPIGRKRDLIPGSFPMEGSSPFRVPCSSCAGGDCDTPNPAVRLHAYGSAKTA